MYKTCVVASFAVFSIHTSNLPIRFELYGRICWMFVRWVKFDNELPETADPLRLVLALRTGWALGNSHGHGDVISRILAGALGGRR